jgi:hypothetical protein
MIRQVRSCGLTAGRDIAVRRGHGARSSQEFIRAFGGTSRRAGAPPGGRAKLGRCRSGRKRFRRAPNSGAKNRRLE